MKLLLAGQISLIICCIFYLIWWRAGFYPGVTVSRLTGKVGILFYLTAVFGLPGVYLSIRGINSIETEHDLISGFVVVGGGAALYVILLIGSSAILHRQVTTELLLIVCWTMLEVMAVQKVFSAGMIGWIQLVVMFIIIAVAAVLSLVFYLTYYNVEPMRGFVYGMIPLITEALTMAVFVAMLRVR
ncbi:hypothetical protein [Butyrivibrio sp. INlla16]|uniref:hypothetical protein n=1 Tax=Butyrivibrio sp. INlla16 TaxID=1520807 RepID=UPI001113B7B5|nr:hypothetical protein [Butyrivibrio sp. INlla16]